MFKKIVTYVLSVSFIAGNILPVSATPVVDSIGSVKEDMTNETKTGQDKTQYQESEYHENIETDKTESTNIYATLTSNFEVTIPKTIILSGETGIGNYSVKVNGDIAGTDKINVVPDENFAMKQNNKPEITATVEQDKLAWKFDEFDTVGVGTVTAELSAGKWNGTFDFNINLERKAKITVTSKNEAGEDLNATATEI